MGKCLISCDVNTNLLLLCLLCIHYPHRTFDLLTNVRTKMADDNNTNNTEHYDLLTEIFDFIINWKT